MSNEKARRRGEHLLAMLRENGRVSVREAAEALSLSEATVRRLFAALQAQGSVQRVPGGVQLPVEADGYCFARLEKTNEAQKRRIGVAAARTVRAGECLYLDCGTTVLQMAHALGERLADEPDFSFTAVTNSIANLSALRGFPRCRLILLGGEYNRERRDFSGIIAEKCLKLLHFQKCYLGCDGLSPEEGFSSDHLSLSSLNRLAMERSDVTAVLMDYSKFGRKGLISYAELDRVNALITDTAPDAAIAGRLRAAGVTLMLANGDDKTGGGQR